MNNKKQIAFASMMALSLLMPVLALAGVVPEPTLPIGTGGQAYDLAKIRLDIENVAKFLIIVGVILAVIFIVWGGIAYMFAGGDETKSTAAKDRIKNGIIGAAVVLAVGVILQTVAGLIARTFFNA